MVAILRKAAFSALLLALGGMVAMAGLAAAEPPQQLPLCTSPATDGPDAPDFSSPPYFA